MATCVLSTLEFPRKQGTQQNERRRHPKLTFASSRPNNSHLSYSSRKRLIQRIGEIWGCPRTHCFHGIEYRRIFHATATAASLAAVGSFAADPQLYVRTAVAFAFSQATVSHEQAVAVLAPMLDDPHPFVRSTAAARLSHLVRFGYVSEAIVVRALQSDTWTVRWYFAAAVAESTLAAVGWKAMRESVPRTDFYLQHWLESCQPYWPQFQGDREFAEAIRSRVSAIADGWVRKRSVDEMEWLFARRASKK